MYMKIDHFYQFAARRRHFELPENPIWRGIPNPNRNYPDVSIYASKYLSTTKNLGKVFFINLMLDVETLRYLNTLLGRLYPISITRLFDHLYQFTAGRRHF